MTPGQFILCKFSLVGKMIAKYLAEYVQCHVCFVNVQSSLHENVVFSVCARMDNAAHIIFIMWNSISGLDAWDHFRFNISCGVAVMEGSHQKKVQKIGMMILLKNVSSTKVL